MIIKKKLILEGKKWREANKDKTKKKREKNKAKIKATKIQTLDL